MTLTTRRPAGLLVLGAVVVATTLRFSGIDARSVWGDEVVSLTVSMGHSWYPWNGEETELAYPASRYRDGVALTPGYYSQRLPALLRINDQVPPFYYVLSNLWLHLFGTSAAGLRSLSLLASVASLPLLYLLGRALSIPQVGTYAAWIFALAPFQVAFGLYNRPYALLGFFAILSTLAAVRVARGDTGRWLVAYAIAITLGVYTHYLFVWNIVFQVMLIAYCQWRNRNVLSRVALAYAASAGAFLLWLPTFLAQVRWSSQLDHQSWFYWYTGQGSISSVVGSLRNNLFLLLSPGRLSGPCEDDSLLCRFDAVLAILVYAVPIVMMGLCGWRLLQHVRSTSPGHGQRPDPWATCLLWAGCVFLGPVVMDLALNSHVVSSHRYFISAGGPVYLAVALAVCGTHPRWLRWSVGAAYLLFLLLGTSLYFRGAANVLTHEMGVREVARHVDQQSAGDAELILVLDPGPNPTDYAYYLRSNPWFARVKIPDRHQDIPDIPLQLQAITAARRPARIWYVDDRGPEKKAQTAVVNWLNAHYRATETRQFSNVGVTAFARSAEAR